MSLPDPVARVPSKLSKLGWYWRRLRAMSPTEVGLRLQKKAYQFSDARYSPAPAPPLDPGSSFPLLPLKNSAPAQLVAALRSGTEAILNGEWTAFGHLPLAAGDPPRWHADNLAGQDLRSARTAFKLDHRAQPGGADIKVIWEPNRWYHLVRLAMAAWLLDHTRAQEKCFEWLHDWVRENPPFTGLNWTSGLETGLRLIQFAWIDAFLSAAGVPHKSIEELRARVLPAHAHYTWRYKSFGSSANNHLLGELAGLIVAVARWPQLAEFSAALPELARLLEREILAQFAEDGGNNEQALGYHLFSWEFCWQSRRALESAGLELSAPARERLVKAAEFYRDAKPAGDPWDFGDSDNAWVTPLFAQGSEAAAEWWHWFNNASSSPSLAYFWGALKIRSSAPGWSVFKSSGLAVFRSDDWFLRFDASPLGYLSMAPHGHLDALHLSVWYRGEPFIIDPGTGCYYADKAVRDYLAGWSAHNSPQPRTSPAESPRRFGTFLWGSHHPVPHLEMDSDCVRGTIALPSGIVSRVISFVSKSNSIQIEDQIQNNPALLTRWKFAPGWTIQQCRGGFRLESRRAALDLKPSGSWNMNRFWNPPENLAGKSAPTRETLGEVPLESLVSPAFRALSAAAFLTLESAPPGPHQITISPG